LHKGYFNFPQAADYSLSFNSFLGVSSITSATNETFAIILPNGANVTSFSPSSMLVESNGNGNSNGSGGSNLAGIADGTAVVGFFPWLGSASRSLPDVTVSFHYPAFNSPVLTASETTMPTLFNPGQNFTLALGVSNNGLKDARDLHFTLDFSGLVSWNQTTLYNSNQVTYTVTSLAVGKTDTHNFSFLSIAPEAPFTLSADYLDNASFAYSWHTFYSLAPNINFNGPLVVTKSLNVTSPSYGQIAQVTTTIHNTSPSQTFYNVLDTTPESFPFNYPNGFGPAAITQPCPNIANFIANTTHFTFQLYGGCSSTQLTQVLVKHGTQTIFQLVAAPNLPLWGGDVWAPLKPYAYPGNIVLAAGESVTLQLKFQNGQSQGIALSSVYPGNFYTYFQEYPGTSYLNLACSPCPMLKGGTTTISGNLTDPTGTPIVGATVELEYQPSSFGPGPTRNIFLANVTTNAQGEYIYAWTAASQLGVGYEYLTAYYPGSGSHNSRFVSSNFYVLNPTTIMPGQTITLDSLYIFNVTGTLTIEPDRVVYSTKANVTYASGTGTTTQPILGGYVALSNTVTLTVGSAAILPTVGMTMNATRLSFYYAAQNQTNVRINITVNNAGPQTATNVVVTALIPRNNYNYYALGRWLPVVSAGTVTSVDNSQGTVRFSAGTLQPGQTASAWYIVKMNTTGGLFVTYSNVTAQGPTGTQYRFTYTGPILTGYSSFTKPPPQPAQGSLQTAITIDPAVIANGTSTTVTLHLYNNGNATLSSINATISTYNYNYNGSLSVTFNHAFLLVPDMAPFTTQTVSFIATDHTSNGGLWYTLSSSISGTVHYRQTAVGQSSGYSSNLTVYNQKIAGFKPTLRVDVSVGQTVVPAGSVVVAIVTVTNTGSSNVTNVGVNLNGGWPELTYGSLNPQWNYIIKPGQTVKFRIGIQTRPGVLYPVFVSNSVYYGYSQPSSGVSGVGSSLSASSAAVFRATETDGPTIGTPWSSPFAPTPSDRENIWVMMSDPTGIGSADLDYSTNKQTWTTIPMTSMIATYAAPGVGGTVIAQSLVGDIYNATIPAQVNGTTIFYRIRASDYLGYPTTKDSNGAWYSYTVLGFNPTQGSVIVQVPSGNNVQVNVAQYIPTVKATITLNLTTSVPIQLTQLSSTGASAIGAPTTPPGQSSLGIYLQIQTPVPITGINAVIRIYYNSTQIQGLNASTIAPYHWETGTSSWVPLDNVQRNTTEMWVQGTASHFSLFAIFAASPAPTCTSNCTKTQPPNQPPWLIIGVVVAVVMVAAIGGFYTTRMRRRGSSSTESTLTPAPASGPSASPGPEPGPVT
jgi:hypothetical protein